MQTLFAALPLLRKEARSSLRIPLPKEGEWLHGAAAFSGDERRPTALLVHGTAGSSESSYIRRAARALVRAGYHAVAIDLRGTNASALGAETLYHAGLTEDLSAAIAHLERDPRVGPIVVVGFSLGGQTALLLASQWGSAPPASVAKVVAASAPLDLAETARRIDSPRRALYGQYVLGGLKRNARSLLERARSPLPFDRLRVERCFRVFDFDHFITAPLHGFASADDYYARVSSGPRLGQIVIPTTLLLAEDDPMVPLDTLLPSLSAKSASVVVERAARGGHLGFVERPSREGITDTWLNRRIVAALRDASETKAR